RLLRLQQSDRLLEVGCGYGRLLWHLRPLAGSVVGMDLHDGPLVEARELLRSMRNAEFILGDGQTLAPIQDNSIDKVVAFTVLQHMSRVGVCRYLDEMRRVLTPGGLGVVNFHDDGVRSSHMLDKPEEQSLAWSPSQICAAADTAGIVIRSLERETLEDLYPGRNLVWWWLTFSAE
ncbi:MAG: class I SAM-dependent methyltransferase, partial [Pyrinomonadaceae bacterium]|nr:class I SAM-dependent methyltransferase [Phycisphaerales bacterium]